MPFASPGKYGCAIGLAKSPCSGLYCSTESIKRQKDEPKTELFASKFRLSKTWAIRRFFFPLSNSLQNLPLQNLPLQNLSLQNPWQKAKQQPVAQSFSPRRSFRSAGPRPNRAQKQFCGLAIMVLNMAVLACRAFCKLHLPSSSLATNCRCASLSLATVRKNTNAILSLCLSIRSICAGIRKNATTTSALAMLSLCLTRSRSLASASRLIESCWPFRKERQW